ncbi:MAG: metal-dependent hydrolase, partial [Azoarcus sp. PHD]
MTARLPIEPQAPANASATFVLSPRVMLVAFLGILLVAPLVLSPFYVTLLNYIGLYAMVALGLVLLT